MVARELEYLREKTFAGLREEFRPDWQGLLHNLSSVAHSARDRGPDPVYSATPRGPDPVYSATPRGTARVYHMELFQDPEIRDSIAEVFDLTRELDARDPYYEFKKYIAVQRFCGFDYVRVSLDGVEFPFYNHFLDDTAPIKRNGGRQYRDEHRGPISSWKDLETFRWPDTSKPEATRSLAWYQANLPEDMCIVSGNMGHFCEYLCWLMGYESLCYALYDQRDLVEGIAEKLLAYHRDAMARYLEFDRMKIIFASDDMGFKGGLLFAPDDMRELVLEGHRQMAQMAHEAGRLYLLHSCGKLADIMEDLIGKVKIDGKHSFEDTIEDVRAVKGTYGRRTALIGGIDVDFLCRANEDAVRERVRSTLGVCQPGGGYCLGTGNSVANYIPLSNYLTMLDEGRLYTSVTSAS